MAIAGRPDEPVLLHDVDDLLEPEQVGLERRHVGEQERQALEPAVGEVPDVERGDVESIHRFPLGLSSVGQGAGGAIGSENENVLPAPSVDSTQIRPPCCSMMWREIARPRPVPPVSPRNLARSTL